MAEPAKPMMFEPELWNKLAYASGIAVIGTGVFALSKIVEEIRHLPGDIVECGTYLGGSAIGMAVTAPEKRVWCFDTFAGMPEVTEFDQHKKGDFLTTLEQTTKNTSPYPNIRLIQGPFKDTLPLYRGKPEIALLVLDCDLYESYKTALGWLYPLVVTGGWIVAEDYMHESCKGAKKACDEFFGEGAFEMRYDFWTLIKQ